MPEVRSRPTAELGTRRILWEGLGDHGFGYMDSLADTGGTLVPRCSRLAGATGAFGDPRFETVAGAAEEFLIFAKAAEAVPIPTLGRAIDWRAEHPYDWDMVIITPLRLPLHRPQAEPIVAAPQVDLVQVLRTLREQAGLPVGDLAAMLGVSRRQFYNWVGRDNAPDTGQEQRIRRSAALIAAVHEILGEPRRVRAALLTTTQHGSAFAALKAGDLGIAEAALHVAAAGPLRDPAAPSQQLPYDRERVLAELEHLRDVPRQGDG
jgi:hypothetical protein